MFALIFFEKDELCSSSLRVSCRFASFVIVCFSVFFTSAAEALNPLAKEGDAFYDTFKNYNDGGTYDGSALFGSKYFVWTGGEKTCGIRVGEYNQSAGAVLYQSGGVLSNNTQWPILGQCSGSAANKCYSGLFLSGDAKMYLTASNNQAEAPGGFFIIPSDSNYNYATLAVRDNALLYSVGMHIGGSNGAFYYDQNGGKSYTQLFFFTSGADNAEKYIKLSGGEMYVGKITSSAAMSGKAQLNGGTFAVGSTQLTSLANSGSSVEIFGNMAESLAPTAYTIDKLKNGAVPAFTTFGTMSVGGDYTQTSGTTIFDANTVTPASSDKLTATGNIALTGGTVLVRTSLKTDVNNLAGVSFQAFSANGTFTKGAGLTVKGSMTGWNWVLDDTGKISLGMKTAVTNNTIQNEDCIFSGSYHAGEGASTPNFNGNYTMTGGFWSIAGAELGFGANFAMQQSGGIVVANNNTNWIRLQEEGGSGTAVSTWTMSGNAKFYQFDLVNSWNGAPRTFILGKGALGQLNITENAVFHSRDMQLGTIFHDNSASGHGIIQQSGGEAYFGTLNLGKRWNSYGTDQPNQYVLNDGTMMANLIQANQSTAGHTEIAPQLLLNVIFRTGRSAVMGKPVLGIKGAAGSEADSSRIAEEIRSLF